MERVDTIILGAGLTGLSTALHLEGDWLLLEKEERVGGLTRTEQKQGFHFDYTGHWMHLRWEHTRSLVEEMLGDDLLSVERQSRVYSSDRYTEYPFQANLHGLPPEVVKECLMGAIEAKMQAAVDEASGEPCAEPKNFLEYVERHFGKGIAKHFMIPYNTKLWGVSPTDITAAWCSRFVPKPNLEQIVEGALGVSRKMGYNVSFVYPAEGGIETLVKRMLARLEERLAGENRREIALRTRPTRIHVGERWMELSDGRRVGFEHLVSTIPLPELLKLVVDLPEDVARWAETLRCNSLRYINLGLDADRPFDGTHWIYFPENRYPFYRVGCASNAVASLAPKGQASCYVELSNAHDVSDDEIMASLTGWLRDTGTIERDEQVVVADFRRIDYGYVIFDDNYFPAKEAILPYLAGERVQSIGRYGAWVYSSMEDALDDGIKAAKAIRDAR